MGLVGAQPCILEPRLPTTERDLAESEAIVPPTDRPLVVLHPGAGDPRRRWPPEEFAAIGDKLAAKGAFVCVTGTEPERSILEDVVDAMRAEAQPLCSRMSLGGLAGLLSRCRLVVSNDSGPLHLAAAVGAATVGIYWCGDVITAGTPARGRHPLAISWRLQCPTCGANTIHAPCEHADSFVADVPVAEVAELTCALFQRETRWGRCSALVPYDVPGALYPDTRLPGGAASIACIGP